MKILLVGGDEYREKTIYKIVSQNLTHRNNIIECSDILTAEDFILRSVVDKGVDQHIDLIIADDILDGTRFQKNLCDWIRSSEESFSNNNFRLSSLPIILYKNDISHSNNSSNFYNAAISFSENNADLRLIYASKKAVREWREKILEDFSKLKIEIVRSKVNNNIVSFKYHNLSKVSRNYDYFFSVTDIVSNKFIKSPSFFDYEWLGGARLSEIEFSIDKYLKIVGNLFKYNGKAFERQVLHKFYIEHTYFLKKDIYSGQIYDKRFYLSSTSKFHIPDFILESPFPENTLTSISEIKRPNIYFEYKPNQHKNFTDYTQNALNQVSNYEDDFKMARMFNGKFQMDLIIGLDDRLTDFVKRKLQKHFPTTNIITHDMLIREVEEYYYRLKSTSLIN